MRILVVEDDKHNRKMVEFLMRSEGYDVDEVDNPQGALQIITRRMPDLILLDINFGPRQLDGFELYSHIREINAEIPVIFVTSSNDLDDKLRGLDIGADDYITKPYAPAEVVARVKRVLHRVYRQTTPTSQQLRFEGIELNIADLCVYLPGRHPILLTPTEMRLLMHLMQHAEQVVSRENLLTAVWGENYPGESNIVDSYIRKLRRKVEPDSSQPNFIRTVRGYGYKFSTKPGNEPA
jgi:two-component system alkaline phosphatase synthesis response regulator PhoP